MDKKFEAKILSALRKLTKQWPPILNAKKKTKIGPELHKCPLCKQMIYTGKKSIEVIKQKYPDAIAGRMDADHISPIVPIEDTNKKRDWNVIIERMFCEEGNIQNICFLCHKLKTASEREERLEHARRNRASE